jgi:hypothetical protein
MGHHRGTTPVRPENLKRLKVLTFSSHVLILDQCAFDPSPAYRDEVSDDATCNLCLFVVALFRSRRSLHLKHLVPRHQLAVY